MRRHVSVEMLNITTPADTAIPTYSVKSLNYKLTHKQFRLKFARTTVEGFIRNRLNPACLLQRTYESSLFTL